MVVHIPAPLGRFPITAVLDAIPLLLPLLGLTRDSGRLLRDTAGGADRKNRNLYPPRLDTPVGCTPLPRPAAAAPSSAARAGAFTHICAAHAQMGAS